MDYYLNKDFNLDKVMTFIKFYQRYYADVMAKECPEKGEEMQEGEMYALSKRVFGKNEDLVDMRSLSDYLVRSLGGRQIIDPLTREDSLWSMIDFFTSSREVIGMCAHSESNQVAGKTIADYLGNQLENASAFERIFKVALRVDRTELAGEFFRQMMQRLREHT